MSDYLGKFFVINFLFIPAVLCRYLYDLIMGLGTVTLMVITTVVMSITPASQNKYLEVLREHAKGR